MNIANEALPGGGRSGGRYVGACSLSGDLGQTLRVKNRTQTDASRYINILVYRYIDIDIY